MEDEDNIRRRKEVGNGNLIWRPVNWIRMLSDELSWRFVLAVVIVYGINQGTSIGLYRVSVQYYMKDVQKLQPSEAQFYSGIIQIPWIIKPLWGLMTDIIPIFRLRRRPYFIFAGLIGSIAMLVPAFSTNLPLVWAILSFMPASAGVAIADATIDACVTENNISHPSLAGDMQSLCGVSSSIGQLVGFGMSGVLVHIIGPKFSFPVEDFSSGKEGQRTMRLIDRPLRPTMLKGFYHETQILSWVLSYDGLHPPDSLAVTAAGIAVALSGVLNTTTIAGVRIGLIGDKFVVNPTTIEMENSKLDLLLAGSESRILMIEGYCDFLPEDILLQAIEVGHVAVRAICKEVDNLVKVCGKPKMLESIKLPPPELYKHVEEITGEELVKALQLKNKIPRRKALSLLEEKVLSILTEEGYVSKSETSVGDEITPDMLEDEGETSEYTY